MTTRRDFTENLSETNFPVYEEPELALVKLRREIEGRLRWLEEHLTPDQAGRRNNRPGEILTVRGFLEPEFYNALKDVLKASDPTEHGGNVRSSNAAIIVETGLSIIGNLDGIVKAAEVRLRGLSPNAKLVYRFLELPTLRRIDIGKRLGIIDDEDIKLSRTDFAKTVFKKATETRRLGELWDSVANENEGLDKEENPFKGR